MILEKTKKSIYDAYVKIHNVYPYIETSRKDIKDSFDSFCNTCFDIGGMDVGKQIIKFGETI